jgi:molecular chaperone GrpE
MADEEAKNEGTLEEGASGVDKRAWTRAQHEGKSGSGAHGKSAGESVAEEVEDIETLKTRLKEAEERAEANLASWQRAVADYQNFKRRTEQERQEVVRLANAALIINCLPLIDDLERALTSVDTRLAGLTWVDGIRLIYRKFQAVLEASGVSEIKTEGETFDPNVHEAVMFGEGEEGKILSEVQRGYKLGDRVIRPAMVIVGKAKEDPETEKREEEEPGERKENDPSAG